MAKSLYVHLRVRRVWRVTVLMKLLSIARLFNIIRSNDHAIDIGKRLTPKILKMEISMDKKNWERLRV